MIKKIGNHIQSWHSSIFIFFLVLGVFIWLFHTPLTTSGKSIVISQIPNQPYRTPGWLMISNEKQSPQIVRSAEKINPGSGNLCAGELENHPAILGTGVMTETFEGTWPSTGWAVLDYSYFLPGWYDWGKRNCHPYQGTYAAWVAGGGTQGSLHYCGTSYSGYMSTVMRYGPVDWSDVISATVTFYLWGESDIGDQDDPYDDDSLFVGSASTCDEMWCLSAGEYYSGDYRNGGETNGYTRIKQNIKEGFGRAEVYITFSFTSDQYNDNKAGFIVDNINLEVETGDWRYLPVIVR